MKLVKQWWNNDEAGWISMKLFLSSYTIEKWKHRIILCYFVILIFEGDISRRFVTLFHAVSKCFKVFHCSVSCCFKVFHCFVSWCFKVLHCYFKVFHHCFKLFQDVPSLRFMPFLGLTRSFIVLFRSVSWSLNRCSGKGPLPSWALLRSGFCH